jgi:hypothetical protein
MIVREGRVRLVVLGDELRAHVVKMIRRTALRYWMLKNHLYLSRAMQQSRKWNEEQWRSLMDWAERTKIDSG